MTRNIDTWHLPCSMAQGTNITKTLLAALTAQRVHRYNVNRLIKKGAILHPGVTLFSPAVSANTPPPPSCLHCHPTLGGSAAVK
jgi:hypothetical protein